VIMEVADLISSDGFDNEGMDSGLPGNCVRFRGVLHNVVKVPLLRPLNAGLHAGAKSGTRNDGETRESFLALRRSSRHPEHLGSVKDLGHSEQLVSPRTADACIIAAFDVTEDEDSTAPRKYHTHTITFSKYCTTLIHLTS
jgi:hypothetical protein